MAIETNIQKESERLSRLRNEALSSQDAIRFYHLTDSGGFQCESPAEQELYERGALDFLLRQKEIPDYHHPLRARRRSVSNSVYKRFLENAAEHSMNIGLNIEFKREHLAESFPGRFGDNGRNPVYRMEGLSVGALYKKIVKYSKRRLQGQ